MKVDHILGASRAAIVVSTLCCGALPLTAEALASDRPVAGSAAVVDLDDVQSTPAPEVGKPSSEAPSASNGIADIIVTATRRETSLQRTPQAISVLTGPAQALKGQTPLEDLAISVPNVNFASTSNTSQLYIRGIGTRSSTLVGTPEWRT